MITISIFAASLVCLLALFLLKRHELAGGSPLMPIVRARADRIVVRMSERLEFKIERFFHLFSKQVIIKGLHNITLIALRFVRAIERRLVRVTTLVRGRQDSFLRRTSTASSLEGITREGRTEKDSNL